MATFALMLREENEAAFNVLVFVFSVNSFIVAIYSHLFNKDVDFD